MTAIGKTKHMNACLTFFAQVNLPFSKDIFGIHPVFSFCYCGTFLSGSKLSLFEFHLVISPSKLNSCLYFFLQFHTEYIILFLLFLFCFVLFCFVLFLL